MLLLQVKPELLLGIQVTACMHVELDIFMSLIFHTELSFFPRGNLLPPDSAVVLSDIGEGSEALFCLTPSTDCCTSRGTWRQPGGSAVSTSTSGSAGFYFSRGSGSLPLNRRSSATGPTGIFRCLVPPGRPAQTLYIGLYEPLDEGINYYSRNSHKIYSLLRLTECYTAI